MSELDLEQIQQKQQNLLTRLWIDNDNIDVDDDDVDNDDDDSRLQVWVHTKQRPNVAEEHGAFSHVL